MQNLKYLIVAAVLTMLSACDSTPEPSPVAAKPTPVLKFRMNFTEVPTNLDPIKANSAYAGAIISNVYDTLYRYQLFTEPYALTPNLAAAMPEVSSDGKTARIRLRTDAYFQDSPVFPGGKGRQVTAEDVVYSLKRHFVPANFSDGAWLWLDNIEGIKAWVDAGARMETEMSGLKAIAPDLLEIRLTQAMPMLSSTLANAYSAVVPAEALTHFGADFARNAVGSGPFMLKEFDGAKAVLIRNPNFRQEKFNLAAEGYLPAKHADYGFAELEGRRVPMVDEIEINFLTEPATVQLAFESGALDLAGVSAANMPRVFATQSPAVLQPALANTTYFRNYVELGSVFVSFNMLDPDLGAAKDPGIDARHRALRCAISGAYNWQERVEKIYSGSAQVFAGVIPPNVAGFEPRNLGAKFDLAGAKASLAAAGYTPDTLPTLQFGSTAGIEQRRMFELFRSQMVDLGFAQEKILWRSFPSFGSYIEAVNRGEVMLMDMGWQFDAPDAENVLQLYYGPYKAPQVNNANYQNAAFDADFERIRSMPVGPERNAVMQAMNQRLIDDCVVISGAVRQPFSVWRKPWRVWPDSAMMAGRTLRFVGLGGIDVTR